MARRIQLTSARNRKQYSIAELILGLALPLLANLAADLELPRKACPALNTEELRRLMGQPDVTDPLGLRDRTIPELL